MLWNVFRTEVIAKPDAVFCYIRKIGRPVKNSYFYMQFFFSFLFKFTVLFTIVKKKGRKTLPRIILCKDCSIVKIVIMIIVGKKNFEESMTKSSVNHGV